LLLTSSFLCLKTGNNAVLLGVFYYFGIAWIEYVKQPPVIT